MTRFIEGYEFTHICEINPIKSEVGEIETYLPQSRYKKHDAVALHAYGNGPFCKFQIPKDLPQQGVYIIMIEKTPHYVGKCENLSQRYNTGYGQISPRNCYVGGQSTNCRINHLILTKAQEGKSISLWFYQTDRHSEVEAELIQKLATRKLWNRSG